MLLATSLLGSSIGIYVCFQMVTKRHHLANPMRSCMLNSMSLALIFAMLVELTTGSKSLGIIVPMVLVCVPVVLMMQPFSLLDLVESGIANLMSVSMSVMLIGMVSNQVVWVIQCALVVIELLLLFTLIEEVHRRRVP
ncbi:hypothetical protein [Alicyclobacillus mengziensis]|uniref:Uncharacterized protein n=1 Tax=Alicyclobacillus mengziensis TaxID=2931921 RepID=A0A9X7W291_9BACL|nr:hypothetical protein [Alicyclobacillus mengziensis]QSO48852.1 hypothetical protein JZ786_07850 [Alicyclobacillus mengziensis]